MSRARSKRTSRLLRARLAFLVRNIGRLRHLRKIRIIASPLSNPPIVVRLNWDVRFPVRVERVAQTLELEEERLCCGSLRRV